MKVRTVLAVLLAAALAGCVTVENNLSRQEVASFKLTAVNVSMAPDAHVWWGDGERAYASMKGAPAAEAETLAKTDEGRAYLRNSVAGKFKSEMQRQLQGKLAGNRPVRIEVVVKRLHIASEAQRILVGGHHDLQADVTIVDARTGAVLLPFPAQKAMARAGQGLLGVAMDQAFHSNEPVDRAIAAYATQYTDWLIKECSLMSHGSPTTLAAQVAAGCADRS